MLDKSFGKIRALEKTMDGLWLRNEAISNNIANVNTPGYKRDTVEFETLLKESLSGYGIKGKTSHEKHMAIGVQDVENIEPTIKKDENTKYRKDGNNVNIDVEMANLAKNNIAYNMVTQRINGKMNKLKLAIKDGR
ncbi:flagellar basal body rod protein FlgB [Geosporobacter ferrireducens]|uniref:Flagellar basal body rod protein FlgB n=1 Tax=Geosporobacter ferrireducens TaxID=1424294 RepID=A0A1D8GBJ0_9FIRM|nr:flagellar basal body rod protein FlgB [Geosporobacter ferrireducens]AOT68287.1 flagellar basal-body rod protein FlgB [Geosporobacter ferrireducens]MTI57290.1 flagellar basal body rod protein FlgB [Geosporobacter ferrireducens]